MLLKQRTTSTVQEVSDPVVSCAICGKSAPLTHYLNLYIGVGLCGYPGMRNIGCGNEDPEHHWACSLPCWRSLAHACIDEHVFQDLLQMHAACPESTHHTTAMTAQKEA